MSNILLWCIFLFLVPGVHRKLEEFKTREGNRDSWPESTAGDSYQKWGTAHYNNIINKILCYACTFGRLNWRQGAPSWISWKKRTRDCRSLSQLNSLTPRDCKMRYIYLLVLCFKISWLIIGQWSFMLSIVAMWIAIWLAKPNEATDGRIERTDWKTQEGSLKCCTGERWCQKSLRRSCKSRYM